MRIKLSQKQIGQKMAELRKRKGLSQAELAKSIKISRPSLAQIELGNRKIDLLEFYDLSVLLGFSLDGFMSGGLSPEDTENPGQTIGEERVSTPCLQETKTKKLLLYIFSRCAGKPAFGEGMLHKILYFADFNYYELYEEQMTGAAYLKMPGGPVPQRIDELIEQMIAGGRLQRLETEYMGQAMRRYFPLAQPDLRGIKASEIETIDKALYEMGDWPEDRLGAYACGDLPCKVVEDNHEISYEMVFYRDLRYSERIYDETDNDD